MSHELYSPEAGEGDEGAKPGWGTFDPVPWQPPDMQRGPTSPIQTPADLGAAPTKSFWLARDTTPAYRRSPILPAHWVGVSAAGSIQLLGSTRASQRCFPLRKFLSRLAQSTEGPDYSSTARATAPQRVVVLKLSAYAISEIFQGFFCACEKTEK